MTENLTPTPDQVAALNQAIDQVQAAAVDVSMEPSVVPGNIGPTKEKVDAWKAQHKRIYATALGGFYFVFRGITYQEYQAVLMKVAQDQTFNGEAAIVDLCILWPEDAPDLTGKEGVIPSLAGAIVLASGFDSSPEIVEI